MKTKQQETIEHLVKNEYIKYNPEEGTLLWLKIDSPFHQYYVGTDAFYPSDLGENAKLKTAYKGVRVSTHSLIHYIMTQEHLIKPNVLHRVNRELYDLRWENLVVKNKHELIKDSRVKRKGSCINTSGVVGVCWDKDRSKWKAYIKVDYKLIDLGRHYSFMEAVEVRKAAEVFYNYNPNY